MERKTAIARIETGARNLDALFLGGLPKGSVTLIAGPPGAGKTILAQQLCFHNASANNRVLYFNTLSEPTAKTLRYLSQFSFFDAKKLEVQVQFIDLGVILRAKGLEEASALIMEQVRKVKPAVVVIDSFKVFDDLAKSRDELRKFSYNIAVELMAWESTALLIGEYAIEDIEMNPLFSIVDGLVKVTQRQQSGEQQRFIQLLKMRGTDHSRDEHPFSITSHGLEVYAPRVTVQREDRQFDDSRCNTGISKLDGLLEGGIPRGSSLLIAGVAGTGKTVLLLEFIYRGAQAGEKGILFSFEETNERLLATARGLGWELEREIERGMVEIVFIPQPNIMVEGHLLMMRERIEALQARRVGVDSVSVFLHKIKESQIAREKIFQLASIIHNAHAVGFFATDIPYGSDQISRFGVEETVVDGVILLSSTKEGLERQRYLEVYKLRNTAHLKGRHAMMIDKGGINIFPRYSLEPKLQWPPPSVETARRLSCGVPGLDELLGGGLLERSVTLVSGSAGIGKSTLGVQFIIEGVKRNEPGLYVALEEGPAQIIKTAEVLGLPLQKAVEKKSVDVLYLSREHIRSSQLLTILVDRIQANGVRRLVLDSVSYIASERPGDLRQLLYSLVARFKSLGVTSLFTLESNAMYSTESATDRDFSPVSDNLLMLRYAQVVGGLKPSLTVVKTRSSPHDWSTYYFTIGKGGLCITGRATETHSPAEKTHSPRQPPKDRE